MSENTAPRAHAWIEINTHNPDATRDYYTSHFGWGTHGMDMGPEMGTYTMFTHNESPFGGIVHLQGEMAQGMPAKWMVYFNTPDVDACAARCEELGGKVLHPPFDIPTIGRTAYLADPHGNHFYAFKSASEGSGDEPMPSGPESWFEIATTDVESTRNFYNSLFGWGNEKWPMGEMGDYHMFTYGGKAFAGIDNFGTGMDGWNVVFDSDDVDAAAADCKARGGSVQMEPHDIPDVGRSAVLADPHGTKYELMKSFQKG
ncbi:MAG: VOC family protein [Fimbriimonadaceae bacterium]|nr:VOC family protein [Fimbriimonadaceae bacterium]